MSIHIFILSLIIFLSGSMEKKDIVTIEERNINGKKYLVPDYNLYGCEKYMLPKLDNAPVHIYFFQPNDIDELYKQQNFNPDECNLKNLKPQIEELEDEPGCKFEMQQNIPKALETKVSKQSTSGKQAKTEIKQNPKPKYRETGFTHFIHIPLDELIGDDFESLIKPQVDQSDQDILIHRKQLHATILAFRLKSEEDLPKWQKIIKSVNLKKAKVYMKGADFFPVKKTFTKVIYLNINGLDDIIDTVVSKGITENLITEKQLSFISFDKQEQMYKANKQHVTILETKGEDLIDAAPYIKTFGKVNFGKVNINKIALSVVGTGGVDGYWNEFVHVAN